MISAPRLFSEAIESMSQDDKFMLDLKPLPIVLSAKTCMSRCLLASPIVGKTSITRKERNCITTNLVSIDNFLITTVIPSGTINL